MPYPKQIEPRQIRAIRTLPSLWARMQKIAKQIGLTASSFAEKAILEKIERIEEQTRKNKES